MQIVATLCDAHIPFHDPKAINVSLKFLKHLKPVILVLHEWMDWYSLSRFDKDPARALELQDDIDITREYLCKIREVLPKTKIYLLESNHAKRLKKYLINNARELTGLRCLKYEELLGLKELNIIHRKVMIFRNVLFKHGELVRKYSSYTARAELEKEGMSGASGHTHRLGTCYKTLRGGKYVWVESGCLCDPGQADYVEGTANWQQGLSLFIFKDNSKHFQPKEIPIINHEIMWGSKIFKA